MFEKSNEFNANIDGTDDFHRGQTKTGMLKFIESDRINSFQFIYGKYKRIEEASSWKKEQNEIGNGQSHEIK